MIREISNGITLEADKTNWIDQNNVVFGYDDFQQCCEDFGWGVYDPSTGAKVADSPSGLPFHFVFGEGAKENEGSPFSGFGGDDVTEWVQVVLEADDGSGKRLVFECHVYHNGYYYHDFSFRTISKEEAEKEGGAK